MLYVKFTRPNGEQECREFNFDDPKLESLAVACLAHKDGVQFTYEDCRGFINLCFEARVDVSDEDEPPDIQALDAVCEIFPIEADPLESWTKVIKKAADYLGIDSKT